MFPTRYTGALAYTRGIDSSNVMNIRDLAQRLAEEGCNPSAYSIGSRGNASDAFCLTHQDGRWRVFYTERGLDSVPMFEAESETDACEYFLRHILSLRHDHCVGFFRSAQQAQTLCERLLAADIACRSDQIPYGGPEDPRFRVFVRGKAIFRARELLGALPLNDA